MDQVPVCKTGDAGSIPVRTSIFGCSSMDRAPDSGSGGCRFESGHPSQNNQNA